MVTTPDAARAVAANGVDVVIAQGSEAGGHRSDWRKPQTVQHNAIGTMSLVLDVVRAVNVPVLAAGGITNGAGVIAALALGAQGVLVGTRFIATQESLARAFYKDALLSADSNDTMVTDAYTGLYARLLRNSYIEQYDGSGAPTLPGYAQLGANNDILAHALERADLDYYPLWAGHGVGMVKTYAPPATSSTSSFRKRSPSSNSWRHSDESAPRPGRHRDHDPRRCAGRRCSAQTW
jgi:nitronate monooxygenase